jgi:integrase
MKQKEINDLNWFSEQKDRFIKVDDNVYIRLRKTSMTYIIRKTINKKAQVITLGKHPALSLRQAKASAANYLRVDTTSTTVETLIKDYLNDVVYPQSKVPKQVEGYLNHIKERFGHMKVIAITRRDLIEFIKSYSKERGARSADRLRSYLIQLFAYGIELGYIDGESPMEGVTKRVTGYTPIPRKRTLVKDENNNANYDDIKMVWSWRNAEQGWQKTEDNVRMIKFLLFTGLRISEAQAGYIDGDKFRMNDTKGKHPKHEKRPHWVYLTDEARALLPLPKCSATNIQAWLKRKLRSEGMESPFTPHDCRRTYATIANENGVEPFIVERALNHRMQGMMAVYNHAEYEAERIECAKVVERKILEIIG